MAPPDDTPCRDDTAAVVGGAAIIEALQAENALLRADHALLRSANAALIERLAESERRLGLNSGNSGKPPSSDGLKKPSRVSSLRERPDKKTGGQNGHAGETLGRVETPDVTIDHFPGACAACGEPLIAAIATDHVAPPSLPLRRRGCSISLNRGRWSSPNIVHTIAFVRLVAR